MPIRYDPLLAQRLGREIAARWRGAPVRRLRFQGGSRRASLHFAGGDALAALLHPSAGYMAALRGGSIETALGGDSPEVEVPFRRLHLMDVHTPPDERLIVIGLGTGTGLHICRLVLELQTNQWNALLVGARSERIEAVLWPRRAGTRVLRRGAAYQLPAAPRMWAERLPSANEWRAFLTPVPLDERRSVALRSIAWLSSLNVSDILGKALESQEPAAVDDAFRRYLGLRLPGDEAWLLQRGAGDQPYPVSLGGTAELMPSLLGAMAEAARRAGLEVEAGVDRPGSEDRESDNLQEAREFVLLRRALEARLLRAQRRSAALQRQLEGPEADQLRSVGHLLLARRGEAPRGSELVTLTDFEGGSVEIELDPALDAVQNAERYFDKARRRERAAGQIPGRIRALDERIEAVAAALSELKESGPGEELWSLAGGRPADDSDGMGGGAPRAASRGRPRHADVETLPYRRLRSAGGLEIRVGRSARDNDSLTFRHSGPEDIWLHARQVRGAHVILRWGRRDQNPPRADLIDAAMAAAVYSGARHSGVVAVDWTRRKYVRKPRKAPPGAVVPERLNTIFVEPDGARVRSLQPEE